MRINIYELLKYKISKELFDVHNLLVTIASHHSNFIAENSNAKGKRLVL